MFLPDALNARVMSRRASGAVRSLVNGAAALVQPVLLTPIPYQKIKQGAAPAYNFAQHFSGADIFALAPGSAALQSGLTISAAGMLGGTATTPGMNVYVTIRATNSTSGLYVDVQVRISVAQDPGTAPAPTLAQLDATTIRATRTAPPVNVPAVEVDLLFGPTSPLTGSNGQIVYGALTVAATYDMTGLSAGARRVAKQRWRVNWGDGTSFPASFAGAESNAVVLAGNSAPSELQAGSISPASGAVGTPFDLTAPVFDGNPTPTVTLVLTQAGVDVTASVSAGRFTSTAAGALVATWTATNGVGSAATSTASATISSAATKPAVAGAPTMTVISSSDIDVYMPADPADGGASISLRQLQFSLDGTVWAAPIDGPPSPYRYTGLAASTYLYSRAVFTNSVGATIGVSASAQTAAASTGSVTLTEFSRDRVVYDSGAALGLDYAAIPFAGTGPAGQVIQARVYSVDDSGVTSSAWVDLATIDGAGNYAGVITAVLNESWYRREVRLKVGPGATITSVNRCAVGHVMAIWGQSEVHRINQSSFSNTTPEPMLTIAQQVDRLFLARKTGRDSTLPMKVVGVDALPAGATLSGRTITFTGTGTFSDWDFQDYQLKFVAGARWRGRQSKVREVVGGLAPNYLIQMMKGGRLDTYRCDMYGVPGSGLDALIREEGSGGTGGTYGKSTHRRMKVTNFPGDFAKVVSAEFYDCYVKSVQNLKKVPVVWSNAATYAVDDYVYITSGGNIYAYASLQAGNLNNQPPTDGTSNAFWSRKAPHSDGINPTEACEKIVIRRCIIDFSQANIANGSVGITNNVRCETTAANYILSGGIEITDCIMDRDPASNQWFMTLTPGFVTNVDVYRNRITPRASNGNTLVNSSGSAVNWADNTHRTSGAALSAPANTTAAPSQPKTNDDHVQMIFDLRTLANPTGQALVHKFISTAQPYTAAFSSMANAFMADRPGEKFVVLWHTLSGTGFTELFNDGEISAPRNWADDFAIHLYGTANGVKVGVASASWFASPIGLGNNYGEAFHQLVTGKDTAGVALNTNGSGQRLVLETGRALPGGGAVSGQQITCDHLWADIYDYSYTKWLLWGPHRFEINNAMKNATQLRAGGVDAQLVSAQACRASVRSMLALPAVQAENIFLPVPFDPLSYLNGVSNGSGGWTDTAHPAHNSPDGLMRWAKLHAHALMRSAGLASFVNPTFDQSYWEPTGAYVEVWSSAGPITTPRLARGLAALGATFSHWGDVFGWEMDGLPVKAQIVAGRVRITPVTGSFDNWTALNFGAGGSTGQVEVPEDFTNLTWNCWPVVDMGAYGLEGIPLAALPAPAALVNTVPGNPMFTSVAGQLSYFRGTTAWPTGTGAGQRLTLYFDGRLSDTGGTQVLASMEGSPHVTLDCTNAGGLRLTVKDATGAAVMTTVSLGTITFGVRFKLIVTFDIGIANACYVTLNGAAAAQKTFAASANGLASSSRRFRFLASGATTPASFAIGNFGELAVWNEYVAGGGKPADDTNLRFRITGPAATANAAAQKLGGDFT